MIKYRSLSLIFWLTVIILLSLKCGQQSGSAKTDISSGNTDTVASPIESLNQEIIENPEKSELFNERAKIHIGNKDFNAAIKDITNAIELDSLNPEYYCTHASIFLETGNMQKSLKALEKALEIDKYNKSALLMMAEIEIILRDYRKALANIDKVITLDENEPKAYFLRGLSFLENGDTLHSLRNFQKAIDINQDYFEAHLQLGLLYADEGNQLAIDYFNNALNIEPGNADIMFYLAMFYQETEDFDNAIKQYNSILQADPRFYHAYYNLGYINLVYLKDFNQAIQYFTSAIEINTDFAEAYYNRGFSYELLHDIDRSKTDYEKTLELSPNYQKAIEGLNRIEEFIISQNSKN
jgi:tetratricopeptide (TPR) repeat protein